MATGISWEPILRDQVDAKILKTWLVHMVPKYLVPTEVVLSFIVMRITKKKTNKSWVRRLVLISPNNESHLGVWSVCVRRQCWTLVYTRATKSYLSLSLHLYCQIHKVSPKKSYSRAAMRGSVDRHLRNIDIRWTFQISRGSMSQQLREAFAWLNSFGCGLDLPNKLKYGRTYIVIMFTHCHNGTKMKTWCNC